jgi:hypothetical protein
MRGVPKGHKRLTEEKKEGREKRKGNEEGGRVKRWESRFEGYLRADQTGLATGSSELALLRPVASIRMPNLMILSLIG